MTYKPTSKKFQCHSVRRYMTGSNPSKLSVGATSTVSWIPKITRKDVESGHFWGKELKNVYLSAEPKFAPILVYCQSEAQRGFTQMCTASQCSIRRKWTCRCCWWFLSGHSVCHLLTLKLSVIVCLINTRYNRRKKDFWTNTIMANSVVHLILCVVMHNSSRYWHPES